MLLEVVLPPLLAVVLAGVRAMAWLLVCPPFAGRAIPSPVKGVLAVGLALPVAPRLVTELPEVTFAALLGAAALQALTGAALGFVTYLAFAAVQAAGDMIDLFGGFSLATAFDPLSQAQTSVFGRLHGLMATTLLFATNGHLLVLRGFLTSYDAVPLTGTVDLSTLGASLLEGVAQFLLAAVQIAGPLVGVLLVADAGLGLLTRVSPQLNAFSLGFPLKILLTLAVVGATFPLLPHAVAMVTDDGARMVAVLLRGGEG